jgi:hypothetical protein
MKAMALKKYLVSRINLIDDGAVLDKIKKIVDEKESKVYILSDLQLERLKEADSQLAKGDFIDQDEMDRQVVEWLKEK